MKKSYLALVAIITFTMARGQANNFRDPSIDVQHYLFQLKLSDSDDHIEGDALIRVRFLKPAPSISFDLVQNNHEGKGMLVSLVRAGEQELHFSQSDDILRIDLAKVAGAGTEKEFEIQYAGTPSNGLIISKNKYGDRTFFADNWPNRAHYWIPCNDHPSDKAAVEFVVTAPARYQVVGNGILEEETNLDDHTKLTHWKEDVALPTKVMAIGVAAFAVQQAGTIACVPVFSWVFPENKKAGFYDYGLALDILPYFMKQVGPYPYRKLANVQSKTMFGGMENASCIFYEENSIRGDRKTESLLAHEIAHQWFGNSVTENHFSNLWLSEGFATYMTDLYLESKYGQDTLNKELLEQRSQVIQFAKQRQTPVVDSSTQKYMTLLNPNSYQKGGWVLHMLRRRLGDSIFWKAISTYYRSYAGKNANTEDLQRVFETVSKQNLAVFFHQWLYIPGHPQLGIQWKYEAKAKSVRIRIEQKQPSLFDFPLQIALKSGNIQVLKTIQVNKKVISLNIPVAFQPNQIITDPQIKLLFESSITEQ